MFQLVPRRALNKLESGAAWKRRRRITSRGYKKKHTRPAHIRHEGSRGLCPPGKVVQGMTW